MWKARRSDRELKRLGDHRTPFERDRARLLHSKAFRRLQAKTQVLGIGDGDFYRTRLTHSVEVAQIAVGLVQQIHAKGVSRVPLPDRDLMETIAIAHDFGHPPFGHGGEVALNYAMRSDGGFEGNGQSLRLLTKLESHTPSFGLDLTRRALLGILKYPRPLTEASKLTQPTAVDPLVLSASDWKPPKCFLDTEKDVVDWLLQHVPAHDRKLFVEWQSEPSSEKHGKTRHKSLDCSIMELADDIAYGVHDLEDGIALGLVSREMLQALVSRMPSSWMNSVGLDFDRVLTQLFGAGERKMAIGEIVHVLMVSVDCESLNAFEAPILDCRAKLYPEARQLLDLLQEVVAERVINLQSVQTLEYRGRYMIIRLFEALSSSPTQLLPESFAQKYLIAPSKVERRRVICDYVAGMTDSYATRMYQRLFVPGEGSVFEKL